ncbi:MAG: hypothetical protein DRO12_01750 [Thermoprotei archaeon]|nr:MAG: hypothetical protein DRO12_01750 [Thermoprotei archaeon]
MCELLVMETFHLLAVPLYLLGVRGIDLVHVLWFFLILLFMANTLPRTPRVYEKPASILSLCTRVVGSIHSAICGLLLSAILQCVLDCSFEYAALISLSVLLLHLASVRKFRNLLFVPATSISISALLTFIKNNCSEVATLEIKTPILPLLAVGAFPIVFYIARDKATNTTLLLALVALPIIMLASLLRTLIPLDYTMILILTSLFTAIPLTILLTESHALSYKLDSFLDPILTVTTGLYLRSLRYFILLFTALSASYRLLEVLGWSSSESLSITTFLAAIFMLCILNSALVLYHLFNTSTSSRKLLFISSLLMFNVAIIIDVLR